MTPGSPQMPHDTTGLLPERRAELLNRRWAGQRPDLAAILADPLLGRTALVSSFGAEAAVLLHQVAAINPSMPVLFVDTLLLFRETMTYQQELARHLGLRDVRLITADTEALFDADPDILLHHFDPDACCALRKVAPLKAALAGFDTWITGRKRYQGGARAALPLFEADAEGRLKVNPLGHWSRSRIADYFQRHDLPTHPLTQRGYPSIGCAPCTTAVDAGQPVRSGRWPGSGKFECGIHAPNQSGDRTEDAA